MATKEEDKALVRSWLYGLLSDLELRDVVEASRTQSMGDSKVTIEVTLGELKDLNN